MSQEAQQCEICGHANPRVIERHHKLPQRFGGPDTPENLVSLCGSCHNAIEAIFDDQFYNLVGNHFTKDGGADKTSLGGHEIDARHTSDREFPEYPTHVRIESAKIEAVQELVERGVLTWDEVASEVGCERVNEDEWQEFCYDLYYNPLEDELTADEEEIKQFQEDWKEARLDPGQISSMNLIHCGYCNNVFLPWEDAAAASHLRLTHGIEDPYQERNVPIEEEGPYSGVASEKVPEDETYHSGNVPVYRVPERELE